MDLDMLAESDTDNESQHGSIHSADAYDEVNPRDSARSNIAAHSNDGKLPAIIAIY